jgi:hypothetical protein
MMAKYGKNNKLLFYAIFRTNIAYVRFSPLQHILLC